MDVANKHLDDLNGGGTSPPSIGLIPDVLPEVQKPLKADSSPTGVSPNSAPIGKEAFEGKSRLDKFRHWYALRTTYGREKKAYEYLIEKNVVAFYPTLTVMKLVNGKKRLVEVSRIPNLFFAYGTEDEIKTYVYDKVNLPYLHFYYQKVSVGRNTCVKPLIVPDRQMESFRIICNAENKDTIITSCHIQKFKVGMRVRVIDGAFKGITGIVARYRGQQRVGIIIDGLLTICTAYVPTPFLEIIKKQG